MNPIGSCTRQLFSVSLVASAMLVAAGTSSGQTSSAKKRTLYSVATQVQYLNNADDGARGMTNNPFNPSLNSLRPKQSWKGNGPFAGDVAIYGFRLYDGANLKKRAGTASYTCYFNYNKNAFCDADYSLKDGNSTVLASGPVDFKRTGFALVVTGGTNSYLGARGQVAESSLAGHNAQRLDFQLLN